MVLKEKMFGIILGATIVVGATFADAADTRAVVRDSNNHVVVNSFNNCVRTDWHTGYNVCGANLARRERAAEEVISATQRIGLEGRTVYFSFDKSDIKPDQQRKLNTLADALRSDAQVREARVFGYADRIGSEPYNDALSQRRAVSVKNYLQQKGFTNARVTETRWFGETVPVTQCPEGLTRAKLIECLAKDRRVEVEIEYLPAN